jgi:hypothetical protein
MLITEVIDRTKKLAIELPHVPIKGMGSFYAVNRAFRKSSEFSDATQTATFINELIKAGSTNDVLAFYTTYLKQNLLNDLNDLIVGFSRINNTVYDIKYMRNLSIDLNSRGVHLSWFNVDAILHQHRQDIIQTIMRISTSTNLTAIFSMKREANELGLNITNDDFRPFIEQQKSEIMSKILYCLKNTGKDSYYAMDVKSNIDALRELKINWPEIKLIVDAYNELMKPTEDRR